MAAAEEQAEDARRAAMKAHKGNICCWLMVRFRWVAGYSTISGMSNVDMLRESAKDAGILPSVPARLLAGSLKQTQIRRGQWQ